MRILITDAKTIPDVRGSVLRAAEADAIITTSGRVLKDRYGILSVEKV